MAMVLPDESQNHHELSRTATSFTYRYGKFGKDGNVKKTWHLAAVSERPVMTPGHQTAVIRQETPSKFAFSKKKEKFAKSLRHASYPLLKNTCDCIYDVGKQRDRPSLSRVSVKRIGHKLKYTAQRREFGKPKSFSSISEKIAKFPLARKYRDYLNQNSEGTCNSDTSESEVGTVTSDTLNSYRSPSTGHRERNRARKDVDIFTVNADANPSPRQVLNKSPRCKPLCKRKSDSRVSRVDKIRGLKKNGYRYLETLRVRDNKTSLLHVDNKISTGFAQNQTTHENKYSQIYGRIKKRKRVRKIFVDGLWIPVRSKKDIQQLFCTDPVVVLERIPAAVLRRLTIRGRQRVTMSVLDTTEPPKEMEDDIDELKQNIAEKNLGGCEYPMDLTNYSLGAPDKLFEVDPSISFNIDKLRKACDAFRSRETSTGPDPVISGYRPEEEERPRSDEPEYVYFDEPTEGDEVFRDPYDMNAFGDSSKFFELQDPTPKDVGSSAKDDDSKRDLRVPNISDNGKNENPVKLKDAVKTPRNIFEANKYSQSTCDSKLDPKGTGFKESELVGNLDIDERLSNIFYRNRDSTDPGEPYSPEYIDHTLHKSPTPPLLDNCVDEGSEEEIPQSPPGIIIIETSFPFEPVSPLRDDPGPSPAQKVVPIDSKPASTGASLTLNVSSPSHVVSSTPVTAAGETVIIEEISSPQNAVLVSDSVQIPEIESDTPIPLRLDGKKIESNSTNAPLEKGACDLETVIELSIPRSDQEAVRHEATRDQNVASHDNRKDDAKNKGSGLCDDFEMDIERDEPYPISMVVVNMQDGADRITQSVVSMVNNSSDGLQEQEAAHDDAQQYDKVYDLSTTTVPKDEFEIEDRASSLTGTTVFGESFPYGFEITPSGTSRHERNSLISSAELDAIERMTNGNLSDDEVFPTLVINEDNSNLGSSANESAPDLVIENVVSLKNVAGNYLDQDYQFKDFNIDVAVTKSNENTEGEQTFGGQNFISEPDNDIRAMGSNNDSQEKEVAAGSVNVNVTEAIDMTSSLGKTTSHVPRDSSPESTKSEGSLKCILTKKKDSGAQVRYVIKSLSSVDSDDPAPFFTRSRDERGDPAEPISFDGSYSPYNARENHTSINDSEISYVTREQAIRSCSALADIPRPTLSKTTENEHMSPQLRGDMQSSRNADCVKPKTHKKSKTKMARDLKRHIGKNHPNLGVGQTKFIKRPLIRRSRISSTLKQFYTRSKSHKLTVKISSPEQNLINSRHVSKKAEKGHVKRTWRPEKYDTCMQSDMSSDLSDLGDLVEPVITRKRRPHRKKKKGRNIPEANDEKASGQKQDTSTGDDLPEILPPKRRRVRPPPPVAQLIEESEVISRLSREFPKHNWLENKIKLFDQNQEDGQELAPDMPDAQYFQQLVEDFNNVDESAPDLGLAVRDENKDSDSVRQIANCSSGQEPAQQVVETGRRSEIDTYNSAQQATDFSKTADSAELHVDLSNATESHQHAPNLTPVSELEQRIVDTNYDVQDDQIPRHNALEQEKPQEPCSEPGKCTPVMEGSHGSSDFMMSEKPVGDNYNVNSPKVATSISVRLASSGDPKRPGELSMKDTLDGMIEARLLEDVREGRVVDLTVPQTAAQGKEPAQAAPQQGTNDADRTGNYWSGSATNFNIRGPQQRPTKHSTPVQRVQPQIKSNHEQPEAARTQAEVVTAIKRQMSKMEEPSASAAGQRSFPGRDSDKAANTGPSTSNVGATSSTVSAAASGPVSVVPPIQTMQASSVPDPHVHSRSAATIPQTMNVHRSAQIMLQQAQSAVINQAHIAQISHPSQIKNPPRTCPQHRPTVPRQPMAYHQQGSTALSQPPALYSQTQIVNSHQNQVVRLEIPIPKTPVTPVMAKTPDFPFPPVSSAPGQAPAVTMHTSPHTSASAVNRQGKVVRPMTAGTFVREYQKMKREFQRIEAMLTIKERERKQLLFMKSRMSLLIDKMENKLRSLPGNYSSQLVRVLPGVNVEQTTTPKKTGTETVVQPGSGSGPPPAHVKEPFTPTVPRTDLRAAHSNKTSTVPRQLIFMDKEMKSSDKPAAVACDLVPQPAHAHPIVTADSLLTQRPECKQKEDDCLHLSAWKRYAINTGQEGCAVHTNPPREQELQRQGQESSAKKNVEIIDLTTETPIENVENQSRSCNVHVGADDPTKVSPEKDKEKRVQELLRVVQVKRSTGNVVLPHQVQNWNQCSAPPAPVAPRLYSPNSGGPPALVPLNASTPSVTGAGEQHSDPRAAQVQRSLESSRGTAVHDSGRPVYTSGNITQPGTRPQYTSGNDICSGLPLLSGYNPPYANHTIGETVKTGNPVGQSPGPQMSIAPNTYFNSKPAATPNRPPDGYNCPPGLPNTTMYGHTNMAGPPAANGVLSSPNLPTDRPSSILQSTPPANALDRSRGFYSTGPSPTTPNNTAPVASAFRQIANCQSASPVRDPTRRPSFPGTPVQSIDMAPSNNVPVANIKETEMESNKTKCKKKAPKRGMSVLMSQPHPMAMQHGQYYRGPSPMMTMDPRAKLSMQDPRLMGSDRRSPHDMYMAHQAEMMPGMIQMSPRGQMMHQVRHPSPNKQAIGFGEQPPGHPMMQDAPASYRQREFAAQHQRMMQTSMGMMPPQQTAPRMQAVPGVMPARQAMMMPPQPLQVPQYNPMQMPNMVAMEAPRGGRELPHTVGGREVPQPMGGLREMPAGLYQADSLCVVCNLRAAFLCSGCKRMWYCSERCQAKSWQERHRMECPSAVL
ncbi:uncharacterized protein LOC135482538 isoform X2 [Lineus longissimus]|uniref:uncharacterized protein LOC135482538 isoform X2 n=1 Tax=Lineus longissimus TaxID=88925 RepID=UPI00315DD080